MLKVGDKAPDFEVPDQEGNKVSLKSMRGKRVVLWFYPKADTPGWTKQGCGFRDRTPDFKKKNVEILGISFDPPAANKAFSEKFKFPFRLLCDTDRKVGIAYGAADDATARSAKRLTFVISPDGMIEQAIDVKDPAGQADSLLPTV
jgi:thioredoxin-dependent peroxiredoxin